MKRLLALAVLSVAAAGWFSPSIARAQEDGAKPASPAEQMSSLITPTPEMWLYLQEMERYNDPMVAVRRNAEFKANARRNRIAAMKWFGMSNQRPQASPMPFMDVYSPVWTGNALQPYYWNGTQR